MKSKEALQIGKQKIFFGERVQFNLEVAALYDYTKLSIPIEVIRGKVSGPTLFISAAIHGDEINGVEIIKRLLKKNLLKNIKGTLIFAPVVNVFGFNNKSRYLPDRRDLNRSFPGTKNGSLAAQIAYIFMNEIVKKSTHGIDLHTGAIHRTNLPQIRACLDDTETLKFAESFGVPVLIHSKTRDGSLREAARKRDIPLLLFEGGEALRFNEDVIKVGVNGCISAMQKIGILNKVKPSEYSKKKSLTTRDSFWVRAPHSGSFRIKKKLGSKIEKGEVIAIISNPFGTDEHIVRSKEPGVLIGASTIPLVNKGDAMFHIATFEDLPSAIKNLKILDSEYDS